MSPFTAVTGSDGIARGTFVAGPGDGGKDGTVVQARLAAMPAATASPRLTVNRKALSIQFGTGNQLLEYSPAVLQKEFAVFVSDSAGNPVKDVAISAAAWPTMYRKGSTTGTPGHYPDHGANRAYGMLANPVIDCDNEDLPGAACSTGRFDRNGNGSAGAGHSAVGGQLAARPTPSA